MTDDPFAASDKKFLKSKARDPGVSFAQYRAREISQRISDGKPHFSLGENLQDRDGKRHDFWEAGVAKADHYFRKMRLMPHHRVIDYGCGSLRTGAHFIRYLDPGCYFGLDVIPDFFQMGARLAGKELIDARRPQFATIEPDSIGAAEKFGADFVFSTAVAIHVHPDELETYFANLQRLAGKPGAEVHLNVALAFHPRRMSLDSWAWPLEFYEESLGELQMVSAHGSRRVLTRNRIWTANLVFRRERNADRSWLSRLRRSGSVVARKLDPRSYRL